VSRDDECIFGLIPDYLSGDIIFSDYLLEELPDSYVFAVSAFADGYHRGVAFARWRNLLRLFGCALQM